MGNKIQGFIQLILVVAFIAASIGISFSLKPKKAQVETGNTEERVLIVETKKISPQDYRIQFEATGNVNVRSEIGIVPQISGRIVSVTDDFFTGGAFEADTMLFQIDLRDFELDVERYEAEVAKARTAFNLEQAESKAAIEEWKLLNGSKKPPTLVARKPQMDEAWANLKAAKAQLENAKLDLERASFSFPFKGRVLDSSLEEGQYVMAGQNYGHVFDLRSLEVRASLKDKELNWLLSTDTPDIDITVMHNNESKTYKGKLNRAAASLDTLTRFATVNFAFAEEVAGILPGVFARIKVKSTTINDVAVLPPAALQKEGIIWILEDNGTLKSHKPEIIYSAENSVIVKGFGQNKHIVISRVSGATDGMKASLSGAQNAEQKSESDGI